jgi:GntR family transcriptional regulator
VSQPLYLQIADDLEEQIKSGDLPGGSQLPTEKNLLEAYGASRNTVRQAIDRLAGKGLIETRAGKGTFVIQKPDPFVTLLTADPQVGVGVGEGATYLSDVSAAHRGASVTKPKVEVQTAAAEVTRRLRVPRDTPLVSRHQQRYIDERPWSLQTSFYPMEFVTRGAHLLLSTEDITQGAVKYLGEAIGLFQRGYRDWITARSPDNNEQDFFRLAHDATVFEIFRTGFDQNQKPMRVTVTVFPTDRNQFIVNVGELPDPRYDEDPNDNDDEDPQVTVKTPGR